MSIKSKPVISSPKPVTTPSTAAPNNVDITTNTPDVSHTKVFSGSALQSYIEKQEAIYMTRPGYDVRFYSRFDENAKVQKGQDVVKGPLTLDKVIPTAKLSSNSSNELAYVTDIKINNGIMNDQGGSAQLTIINPDTIHYFNSTLGKNDVATIPDYDFSPKSNTHRIGTMDTIVIKLNNKNKNGEGEEDVVFRGVVSEIKRKKSVEGSVITLICMDFCEWLRQIVAIRFEWFSTISFSVTGRQLIQNLMDYANTLYHGDNKYMGDLVGKVNFLTNAISGPLLDQLKKDFEQVTHTSISTQGNLDKFKIDVPPLFFIDRHDDILNTVSNFTTTNLKNIFDGLLSGDEKVLKGLVGGMTVEDKETIDVYSTQFQKPDENAAKFKTNDPNKDANKFHVNFIKLARYGWVFSDLYVEKGLLTFEHQRIWSTMQNVAKRALREVYFDFAPKLRNNPTTSVNADEKHDAVTDVATLAEIKATPSLKNNDCHPNVGILKYRLSPCMLPYPKNGHTQTSQFYKWAISDNEVLMYDSSENQQSVKTAVLMYGSTIDNAKDFVKAVFAGEETKAGARLDSIDSKIVRRLGYRFMTDADMKITFPIIKYFVGNILLQQSQLSMFSQNVTVLGNPKYQPGCIVKLNSYKVDYYCDSVQHNWSLQNGYTTTLGLKYGHKTGVLPLTYIDVDGTGGGGDSAEDLACNAYHATLDKYIGKNTQIGDVDTDCLVKAIWQYHSNGAQAGFEQNTKEYQHNAPKSKHSTNTDWIPLNNVDKDGAILQVVPISQENPPPMNFNATSVPDKNLSIAALVSCINQNLDDSSFACKLRDYNVTVNTVLNIIKQESSFRKNVVGPAPSGYGLMQLTDDDLFDSEFTRLQATLNMQENVHRGMRLLAKKFKGAKLGPSSPAQARGRAWLEAIKAYNGAQASDEYLNNVFGADVVAKIQNGDIKPEDTFTEKFGTKNGENAHYTYGPLGIRVHQAQSSIKDKPLPNSSAAYKATVKQLVQFDSGMKLSVAYIVRMLNKYKDKNTQFQGFTTTETSTMTTGSLARTDGPQTTTSQKSSIDQSSTLEKTIAAWWTDEGFFQDQEKNSVSDLLGVIGDIKSKYSVCQTCKEHASSGPLGTWQGEAPTGNKFASPLNDIQQHSIPRAGQFFTDSNNPRGRKHDGIDIDPIGRSHEPVFAIASGVVELLENPGGYGHYMIITHDGKYAGFSSYYAHLIFENVQNHQRVQQGQQIGNMGGGVGDPGAGDSTGEHLHFEIRYHGKPQPPNNYLQEPFPYA